MLSGISRSKDVGGYFCNNLLSRLEVVIFEVTTTISDYLMLPFILLYTLCYDYIL